ncbi:lipopolysaccharide biosynthesis protein [Psychromonas algicola]|uniref:lipopolysaccharide biosynthesis protein n=1 Tax=Psychromonas algicola TaxID=2555642 RepID=UPI00106882E0|nr:lipopolysaccharide biosynthesis protein [Psychromonas sp. RZ5]TEW52316.1 lipopolysaccharide biosynthesis protein [Psychromonas sp. RZ5]
MARAKIGSFALVLLASLLVIVYFTLIASPRYVSQVQFVVKQASSQSVQLGGLMALGGSSTSTRDALILQEYILSQEMAFALDNEIGLRAHYQQKSWDALSRLRENSSKEEYVTYYQDHVTVRYDELSEILLVEAESFDPEYALLLAQSLLDISKKLINGLGDDMAQQHMDYAKGEVQRAYNDLKKQQIKLINFQDKNSLFNPEMQSAALFSVINEIESSLIEKKTQLKSLQAYLRADAPEIKALGYEITALTSQLQEEKSRLTNQDKKSLNKINFDFKELELNAVFAADLYKSALTSLEVTRAEAFENLKYLLVIVHPRLAEDQRYPERLYSIFTWFVVILLIYLVGRLILSVIKEHHD